MWRKSAKPNSPLRGRNGDTSEANRPDRVADGVADAVAAEFTSGLNSIHPQEPSPAPGPAAIAAPEPVDPTTIASIVDSMLAELRPRLVEEIAKKMGKDRK